MAEDRTLRNGIVTKNSWGERETDVVAVVVVCVAPYSRRRRALF